MPLIPLISPDVAREADLAISYSPENSPLSTLEILRTRSLTSVVREEIERMIWDGELDPKEQ